jgi:hypothetical protein
VRLEERVVALHRALARRQIPHAFGGAIALAYWTKNPRGTTDIDVNVFVPTSQWRSVFEALPAGVKIPDGAAERVERDGQIRLFWERTPVDLFFDYAPVHRDAALHRETVPFLDTRIPVLGPDELTVFKARFDRIQDWADIEAMLDAGAIDLEAVRGSLGSMLPEDDWRFTRLVEAERRAAQGK